MKSKPHPRTSAAFVLQCSITLADLCSGVSSTQVWSRTVPRIGSSLSALSFSFLRSVVILPFCSAARLLGAKGSPSGA
jgi:hypothetical protein